MDSLESFLLNIPLISKLVDFRSSQKLEVRYESVSTALLALVVLLKLFVNSKTSKDRVAEKILSLPGEITFVVIAYMAALLSGDITDLDLTEWALVFVLCLIILVLQYSFENRICRTMKEGMLGKENVRKRVMSAIVILFFGIMAVSSLFLYFMIVCEEGLLK